MASNQNMRALRVSVVALMVGALSTVSNLSVFAQGYDTTASLVLDTYWGRAMFRQCSFRVSTFPSFKNDGRAQLTCQWNASPHRPDLTATRTLTFDEAAQIRELAGQADLYGGGHVGASTTASDGYYETLSVVCCKRGQNVVLVTSYNPTFTAAGSPRKRLLDLLHRWQNSLQETKLKK